MGGEEGGQEGMRWVERRRAFIKPLLIADAVVQALPIATLWTFSTRAAACGALLLSAWLENVFLRHHCRIKDWRYSQAARQVCDLFVLRLMMRRVACVVRGEKGKGRRWAGGHALG